MCPTMERLHGPTLVYNQIWGGGQGRKKRSEWRGGCEILFYFITMSIEILPSMLPLSRLFAGMFPQMLRFLNQNLTFLREYGCVPNKRTSSTNSCADAHTDHEFKNDSPNGATPLELNRFKLGQCIAREGFKKSCSGRSHALSTRVEWSGVEWPSGLAYRTQVLVLAAECGFESRP